MTELAKIVLYPNRFTIAGPTILQLSVEAIARDKTLSPEQARDKVDDLLREWHVLCSVTGNPIRLCNLKYWDVEKQTVYAKPELVPVPDCYR